MAAPVNSVAPAITGSAEVEEVLSLSDGTWSGSPTSYTYAWLRDDAAISGETAAAYTVAQADIGAVLTGRVTATNADGSTVADSADTATVPGTLVVEDGTGLTNADSYVSMAWADSYLRKRARAATWDTYSDGAKEAYLRAATEYLDAMCSWRGDVANQDQTLGWPRFDACDKWDRLIANNIVPNLVKVATVEIASQGAIAQVGEQMIKQETIGPITTVYENLMDRTVGSALYQLAFDLVASLTMNRGGAIPVVRS